jgi:hypothetical protein
VEETTFDTLLRKAAQQSTRRGALGALLGGALLLNNRGEIEASDKAKRRKQNKRQKFRKQQAENSDLKLIRVRVKNPGPTAASVHFVNLDDHLFYWLCTRINVQTIRAGSEMTFLTSDYMPRCNNGLVWLNNTYSIEFWNLLLRTPAVSAAVNGVSMNNRRHCPKRGTRALNHTSIDEGMTFKFSIHDKQFTVERGFDTAYKEFVLTLPTNL